MPDKILGMILAALLPTLSYLISKHIISASDAKGIGAIVFAAVSGWHGQSLNVIRKQNKEAKNATFTEEDSGSPSGILSGSPPGNPPA